jgi:hypothetical protein
MTATFAHRRRTLVDLRSQPSTRARSITCAGWKVATGSIAGYLVGFVIAAAAR